MAKPGAGKKASAAQKAQYAPKPKLAVDRAQPKSIEKHLVSDDILRKIIQRALEQLKMPGNIPSEVLLAALTEVRERVEHAAAAAPPAKPR